MLESLAAYGKPDATRGEHRHQRRHRQGPDEGREGLRQPLPAGVAAQQEGPRGAANDRRRSSGYVVVDLSSGIAGAYCTKLLADGGAEVIKVEPPEGDPLRRWSASGAGDPRRRRRRAVHVPVVDEAERGRRPRRRRRPRRACTPLLDRADAVVWSKGSRLAECPALAPDAIRARRAAPDRHGDHAVRPRGAVVRPAGHRVHAAGVVRRDRRPRPRRARPGARCSWAGRSASGSPARPGRHRHDGLAGPCARRTGRRAGRRLDARDAGAVPHLLPGDLRRHGRAGPSGAGGPSSRPGVEAASDGLVGPRRRHRPAVARLLRDGRAPRVDGGPLALRQPRPPAARRSRHGWPSARRRRSSSWPARSASRTRPSATAPTIPTTDHFEARGSIVAEPARRLPRARPAVPVRPAAAPHRRAGSDAGRARRTACAASTHRGDPAAPRRPPDAAVRRAAGPRPDRVLGRAAAAPTCWRCSAPR